MLLLPSGDACALERAVRRCGAVPVGLGGQPVCHRLCAPISAIGCLNGWTLLQGECRPSWRSNGVFPRIFAQMSPPQHAHLRPRRHQRPRQPAGAGHRFAEALVGVFTFMVLLSTTACLVMYGVCALAMLRLNATGRLGDNTPRLTQAHRARGVAVIFRSGRPMGPAPRRWCWGAALLAAGIPVYWLVERGDSRSGCRGRPG